MDNFSSLNELLKQDSHSRLLYDHLPKDVQVALQEQRQNIRTYDDLTKAAAGFEKRSHR